MEAKMLSDFHMGLRPAGSAEKKQNNQINWLKPDSSQSIFQIFRFYFILRRKTIAALRGSLSLCLTANGDHNGIMLACAGLRKFRLPLDVDRTDFCTV